MVCWSVVGSVSGSVGLSCWVRGSAWLVLDHFLVMVGNAIDCVWALSSLDFLSASCTFWINSSYSCFTCLMFASWSLLVSVSKLVDKLTTSFFADCFSLVASDILSLSSRSFSMSFWLSSSNFWNVTQERKLSTWDLVMDLTFWSWEMIFCCVSNDCLVRASSWSACFLSSSAFCVAFCVSSWALMSIVCCCFLKS